MTMYGEERAKGKTDLLKLQNSLMQTLFTWNLQPYRPYILRRVGEDWFFGGVKIILFSDLSPSKRPWCKNRYSIHKNICLCTMGGR